MVKIKSKNKYLVLGDIPKKKQFIVKIQIPLGGDLSNAVIYNKDRSFMTFWPVAEVLDLMDGEIKKYFLCTIKSGSVSILEEVEGF